MDISPEEIAEIVIKLNNANEMDKTILRQSIDQEMKLRVDLEGRLERCGFQIKEQMAAMADMLLAVGEIQQRHQSTLDSNGALQEKLDAEREKNEELERKVLLHEKALSKQAETIRQRDQWIEQIVENYGDKTEVPPMKAKALKSKPVKGEVKDVKS